MSGPTTYEKNNLPIDVRLAFNQGVELWQSIDLYEKGLIDREEFINEIRNTNEKFKQ